MNIAIKGHKSRGNEVIKILESLGGVNKCLLNGESVITYYYIDDIENYAIHCHDTTYVNKYCKKYTLEEFEKEFPFKIGDKVIHKEFNDFFEIISFNPELTYPYKIKGVCEFDTKSYVLAKYQPKMKEERFVTLTLDKAKEWYKKGGELKEIALQVFTEKELNPLPRSWEEYCRKYGMVCLSARYTNIPLKYDALLKLEQLRNCWRQNWIPKIHAPIYAIKFSTNGLKVYQYNSREFLSFPTKEMAEEFLECFRDLIEKAGDLI